MENQLKKIGILAFSEKNVGGVLQYTQTLIDTFSFNEDFEFIIFSFGIPEFNNNNIKVRQVNKSKLSPLKKIVMFFQLLFNVRNTYCLSPNEINTFQDIDFFIEPSISVYPHFFLNKPFVFTLHDLQEKYYPEFFSKSNLFQRWLVKRCLAKSSNHIICESTCVKNDIINFLQTKKNKITVLPAPPTKKFIDFKFDRAKFLDIENKYNLPKNYIFYPAQFWKHKNHIKLVEAFNIVSKRENSLFLVLTGVKENNYSEVMKKIKELKLEKKIIHLGYIDYADLAYIYKMSKMLIMPTLFESISIPVYEAFSLKVPVCCSNVVALPEQIGDAGVLFNPNDENELADKILTLLKDDALKEVLVLNGYKKIADFDYHGYKNQFLNIIKNTINKG